MTETDLFDLDFGSLAQADGEGLAHTLTDAVVGLLGEATMIRARAVAQQREAVKLLRQADHVEQITQYREALAKVETALTNAERNAAALSADVDQFTAQESEAREALADAEQHHGELAGQHETYRSLAAKASRLSESLYRLDAAARVLNDARARQQSANTALANARRSLTEAQAEAATFRTARDAAKALIEQAEANPDAAPRSLYTLLMDWPSLANPAKLTEAERSLARGLVATISAAIGADEAVRQAGREETLAEAQNLLNYVRGTPSRGPITVVPRP